MKKKIKMRVANCKCMYFVCFNATVTIMPFSPYHNTSVFDVTYVILSE